MENILKSLQPRHEFLICIDSDGCVFDNMEVKHKECFCPATVNVWELQGVSRFAREAAEFVNLYSMTRGTNRFPALIRTLELTYSRPEVQKRGYRLPDLSSLKKWISETPALSGGVLEKHIAAMGNADPILAQAVKWSREVDANISHIVRNVPPFPYVVESLKRLMAFADIVIVSATPHEAIVREWEEHHLTPYVTAIAGQEMGTKKECIAMICGRYGKNKVMMVGDAPGDHSAARDNDVLYYPIVPGRETDCWKRMLEETAGRFQSQTYAGAYMETLLTDFYAVLLDRPSWEAADPR